MTDPVPHENWIDAPYPFAPSTDPPDDIDKALDTLADAIVRANGGERRSMASHLARNPAVAKVSKVLGACPPPGWSPSSTAMSAANPTPRTFS